MTKMASFLNETYATSSVSSSHTDRLCTFMPCPLFSPTVTCTMYLYLSSLRRPIKAGLASALSYLARVSFQFSLSAYRRYLAPKFRNRMMNRHSKRSLPEWRTTRRRCRRSLTAWMFNSPLGHPRSSQQRIWTPNQGNQPPALKLKRARKAQPRSQRGR